MFLEFETVLNKECIYFLGVTKHCYGVSSKEDVE